MLQRRLQEQRTLQPYVNELFHALFATTAAGPLTAIHDIHAMPTENDDEASSAVQIRKMETIGYAIVPSMKGGNNVLEPFYKHMMETFLSFAARLFDTSCNHTATSSYVQRRAATSIEVMTMIGQTLFENTDTKTNVTVKQLFTSVAQQILLWIVPALSSNGNTTTTAMTLLHRQFVSSCIRITTIYSNEIVSIYPPYLQFMIPYIVGQITDPTMDIELSVRLPVFSLLDSKEVVC